MNPAQVSGLRIEGANIIEAPGNENLGIANFFDCMFEVGRDDFALGATSVIKDFCRSEMGLKISIFGEADMIVLLSCG